MVKKKKDSNLTVEERLEQALIPNWDEPYKLPDNWCWTKLSMVSDVVTGSTPSKNIPAYYGDKIPFFKPADLNAGRNTVIASEYLSDDGKRVSRVIPAKSTAVCCIGSIGKSGYLEVEGTTNQQINSLIPKINPLYLYYFVNTDIFINELREKASATTISIVNKSKMETNKIPLAPLKEQQRIVENIESLFNKLDEAKEKAQEVIDGFEMWKASIFHKAFSGELTVEWREENNISINDWKHQKFSDLCKIVRGGSPRPAGSPEFYGGDIPFMKVADITKITTPYVETTEHFIKPAGLKKTRVIEANTLLLTNSGATLGVPAICTFDSAINDGIAAFLDLNPETLLFYYYFWAMKTPELRAINKGAAQPNLNTDIIGAVELDVPTIEEQKKIVEILESMIFKEQLAKEIAIEVIQKIDVIKKAILTKAFRGELNTNDPSEESSLELLKSLITEATLSQENFKGVSKKVSIHSKTKLVLSNIWEEEIYKLFMKNSLECVSIEEIMSLSSKKFELMEALRNLERKNLIMKNEKEKYLLKR